MKKCPKCKGTNITTHYVNDISNITIYFKEYELTLTAPKDAHLYICKDCYHIAKEPNEKKLL